MTASRGLMIYRLWQSIYGISQKDMTLNWIMKWEKWIRLFQRRT